MDQLSEFENSFIELYESAELLINSSKFKSAVILLSKALFALADYILFREYGKIPKSHSDRFRALERKNPGIYTVIDKVWSKYIDTYSKPSSEESFELLRESIVKVMRNEESCKEIKKIIEQ